MSILLHYLSSTAQDDETINAWLNSYKQGSLAERSQEARLLLAILEQSLTDLSNPRELRSAQRWILDKEAWGLTSFNHVCTTLNFHATSIRSAIFKNLSIWERGWPGLKAYKPPVSLTSV